MLLTPLSQMDHAPTVGPARLRNNLTKTQSLSSGFDRKPAASSTGERPQQKRRSVGFFRSLVHESRDVLLAPFQSNQRRKSGTASGGESKNTKERGTQTRSSDCAQCCPYGVLCGSLAGNGCLAVSAGNVNNPNVGSGMVAQQGCSSQAGLQSCHYLHSHRMRRNSRARSDPSTRCSLSNLSALHNIAYGAGWSSVPGHQQNLHSTPLSSTLTLGPSSTSEVHPHLFDHADPLRNDPRLDRISSVGSSPRAKAAERGPPLKSFSVAGGGPFRGVTPIPLSRTLPARLEPQSALLSPEWSRLAPPNTMDRSSVAVGVPDNSLPHFCHNGHNLSSLRRSVSSVSSVGASPLYSACCCPNEVSHRLTSASSQPCDQRLFLMGSLIGSVYRSMAGPLAEELMRYPWGRDSLWLMAFVLFASSLVLLGYIITTVLPTMMLAVCLAICKSLIFNRKETVGHLRALLGSVRCSLFTREVLQSLRLASLQVVHQTLRLLVPPILTVPTSVEMHSNL